LKSPLILIAAESPTDAPLHEYVAEPLAKIGFIPEIVTRWSVPSYLHRAALASRGRPDAVVFAPNFAVARPRPNTSFLANPKFDEDFTVWGAIAQIRDLSDSVLLAGHVRAKTVPIVVAYWPTLSYGTFFTDPPAVPVRWVRVSEGHADLVEKIVLAIRDWRRDLFESLSWIGYAITRDDQGRFHVGHALRRPPRENDLLGEDASWQDLRRSNFYIVSADVGEDVPAWQELEDLLDTYERRAALRRPRVKPETILQEFFETHAHMIFRGLFESNVPKLRIPDPQRGSGRKGEHIPDFAQLPRSLSMIETRTGLLDLKLPKEQLLERSRFHRDFTRSVHKAVAQLTDYRDRLAQGGSRMEGMLKRQLGYVPQNPRLAVIIGRRPPKADLGDFEHRARTTVAPIGVDLVTYDDILDREEQRLILQSRLLPDL